MTKSLLPAGCIIAGVDGSEHAERAIAWNERAPRSPWCPKLRRG